MKKKKILSFFILIMILACMTILRYRMLTNISFSLIGDELVYVNVYDEYEENGATLIINDVDYSSDIKINANLNCNQIGEYTVYYSYPGINKKIKRTVIVKDMEAPILSFSYTEKKVALGSKFVFPIVSAQDNMDGDLTDKIHITGAVNTSELGTYVLGYKVQDSNNNISEKEVIVHVVKKSEASLIKVNISEQKLYYYENDEIVLESDVVTGIYNKTPRGTFAVNNKARNVYLVGRDYKSYVEYWIAFKGISFGFHDASWRNKFGGNIYLNNGSHGCVNMPKDKVAELYKKIEIGTPVIIE